VVLNFRTPEFLRKKPILRLTTKLSWGSQRRVPQAPLAPKRPLSPKLLEAAQQVSLCCLLLGLVLSLQVPAWDGKRTYEKIIIHFAPPAPLSPPGHIPQSYTPEHQQTSLWANSEAILPLSGHGEHAPDRRRNMPRSMLASWRGSRCD